MAGYMVQIRRESLGGGPPSYETVCALANDEQSVITLVRTALRLGDEAVGIVRALSEQEIKTYGLKPFQVKHVS